jgi:phage/plasmid-like protein (TIGR03299 family)
MTTVIEDRVPGVNKSSWKKGGTAVNATSASDAARQAGLDWTVSTHDMSVFTDKHVLKVDKKQAVVKTDSNKQSVIGVVGSKYKLVQNMEVFNAMDGLIDSGDARYTAAGEYDGGSKVWMIMELPTGIQVANDPHTAYLLVKTSHDGSSSVIIKPIIERIWCANQINRLISGKKLNEYTYTMKHTTNAVLSVQDIRNITQLTYNFTQEYSGIANNLLHRKSNEASARGIFESVWALPSEVEHAPYDMLSQGQRRQKTIALEARAKAYDIYATSPTQENIRDTAFGAWQAVVEYADHYAKGGADKRAIATLSGSNDRLKTKALSLALTI